MARLVSHVRGNAIAYAALFIALGGTSYAAVTLPARSVGNTQLKSNAVTSSKVKNRSLRAVDFATGQLPRGAQGPAGAAGPAGPPGPAGASGSALWAVIRADGTTVRSSGVVSSARTNAGEFTVRFNRDVKGCAQIVSLGGWSIGGEVNRPGPGEAQATVLDFGTAVSVETVTVYTRNSDGTNSDKGFHLAVFC
jgi:hypothetical protein